jgi:hypothetical protein
LHKSVVLKIILTFMAVLTLSSCTEASDRYDTAEHTNDSVKSGLESYTNVSDGADKNANENNDDNTYHVVSGGTSVMEYQKDEPKYTRPDFVPDNMVTYYGYYQLNDYEKTIYNELTEMLGNYEPTVPLMTDTETFEKILEIIRIEQLSYSHVSGRALGEYNNDTKMYDVNITYRFSENQLKQMNFEAEKKADEIMANVTDDMSDYDKLKYFHDYLILNCQSDTEDEYADTIYGTLIRGKALCEGYAKTFSYLCNRAGIENIIVTGRTSVPHMWNMVKVDGEWYHIDVTWDKPDKNISPYCPGLILYQYFMATDSVMENYREIDRTLFTPPKATSTRLYYFVKENLVADDFDSTYKIMRSEIIRAKATGKHYVMIKFNSSDIYIAVYNSITSPDENGKCTIDYLSNEQQVPIIAISYYSLDRVLLLVLDY